MTRTGLSKRVDAAFASGRLKAAREFRKSANDGVTMLEPGDSGNPAMSQIVNAAIAYTDALTGLLLGLKNQKDHSASTGLLRDALGKRLPDAKERILREILEDKDDIQYGFRTKPQVDATAMLDRFEEFANWAEEMFRLSK